MKTLVSAILVAIAVIPATAQEGKWIGELRSLHLRSHGSFTARISIDPDGELLRELAVIADSANIEPIISVWTDIGGS